MPSAQLSSAQTTKRGADRRRAPRRGVALGGQLFFGLCGLSIDCVIRDISDSGARVAVPKASWRAPSSVKLLSAREGRVYCGKMVWNRGRYLGLDFTSVHDLRTSTDPELAPIRAAWLKLTP
jgi:hypothetical protein